MVHWLRHGPPSTGQARGATGHRALRARVGATFHVAPDGDDAGPGTEAAPFRTIRHALAVADAAGPGQRVRVHAGTYVEGDPGEDEHALRIATEDTTVYAAPGEVVEVRPAPGVAYGVAIAASRATWSGIAVSGFPSAGIDVHDGGVDGTAVKPGTQLGW